MSYPGQTVYYRQSNQPQYFRPQYSQPQYRTTNMPTYTVVHQPQVIYYTTAQPMVVVATPAPVQIQAPTPAPIAKGPAAVQLGNGSVWTLVDPSNTAEYAKYPDTEIGGKRTIGLYQKDGKRGYLFSNNLFYEINPGNTGYVDLGMATKAQVQSDTVQNPVPPVQPDAVPTPVPVPVPRAPVVPKQPPADFDKLTEFFNPKTGTREKIGTVKHYPYNANGDMSTIAYTQDSKTRIYLNDQGEWAASELKPEVKAARESREQLLDRIRVTQGTKTMFQDPEHPDVPMVEARFSIENAVTTVRSADGSKVLAQYVYQPSTQSMIPLWSKFEGPEKSPNYTLTPDKDTPYTSIFGENRVLKADEPVSAVTYLDVAGNQVTNATEAKDALFARVFQAKADGSLEPVMYWNDKGTWKQVKLENQEGIIKVRDANGKSLLAEYLQNPQKDKQLELLTEFQTYPIDAKGGNAHIRYTASGARVYWNSNGAWEVSPRTGDDLAQAKIYEAAFDETIHNQTFWKKPNGDAVKPKITLAEGLVRVANPEDPTQVKYFYYQAQTGKMLSVEGFQTLRPADGTVYYTRYAKDPKTSAKLRLDFDPTSATWKESPLNAQENAGQLRIREAWEGEQAKLAGERDELIALGQKVKAEDIAVPKYSKSDTTTWWHREKTYQTQMRMYVQERDTLVRLNSTSNGYYNGQIEKLNAKIGVLAKYKEDGPNHSLIRVDRRDPGYQAMPTRAAQGNGTIRWHNNVSIRTLSGSDIGYGQYDRDTDMTARHYAFFGPANANDRSRTGTYEEKSTKIVREFNMTPQISLAPDYTIQSERRILLLFAPKSADHNSAFADTIDKSGKSRDERDIDEVIALQQRDKKPVTDKQVVYSADRNAILESIRKAGDGVKPGEAVTIVVDYHGWVSGSKVMPAGFSGLEGTQNSHIGLGNGNRLYFTEMMDAVNSLAEKGIKVNVVFNSCGSGGGLAKEINLTDTNNPFTLPDVTRTHAA